MVRRLLVLALVPVLLLASPAAAAPSFGPITGVAVPCPSEPRQTPTADTALGGGVLRAFASSGGCAGRVVFSSGGSQGWTSTPTPYRGNVLAVAADDRGTYVLLVVWDRTGRPTGLGVAQRTHDGRFWPVTVLSTVAGTGAVPTQGDLAVRDGRWWAVWSEQVGPGGEFAHQQLFQAGTVPGLSRTKARVFSTPADVEDAEPALTVDARGAVLAWTRATSPAVPGPAEVWVAVSTDGTWQRARAFGTAGEQDSGPDVLRVGAVTILAWQRDGRVVEADDSSGSFREHVFLVRGDAPRVALAGGSLMTAWTAGTETDASFRVLFARSPKGGRAWTSAYASGAGEHLLSLVGVNGRATLLHPTGGGVVVSRTGG